MRAGWKILTNIEGYLLFFLTISISVMSVAVGKHANIPLSEADSYRMYDHWLNSAYSGIIAALANERLKGQSEYTLRRFGRCSKAADTVSKHAKCLQMLIDVEFPSNDLVSTKYKYVDNGKGNSVITKVPDSGYDRLSRHSTNNDLKSYKGAVPRRPTFNTLSVNPSRLSRYLSQSMERNHDWIGGFRLNINVGRIRRRRRSSNAIFEQKPNVFRRDNYSLLTRSETSPLGAVAKMLNRFVVDAKGKDRVVPWQQTVQKVRMLKLKEKENKRKDEVFNSKDDILPEEKAPSSDDDIEMSAFEDSKLNRMITRADRLSLTNNDGRSRFNKRLVRLLRDGVKLGYGLAGRNMTEVDRKNIRVASPKFFSVNSNKVDQKDTINLISPSLFSMAVPNDGDVLERKLSMQSLAGIGGENAADQQNWLNLIMEISGVNDRVDQLLDGDSMRPNEISETVAEFNARLKAVNSTKLAENFLQKARSADGEPLYFTRENVTHQMDEFETQKMDTFQALLSMIDSNQWGEMGRLGYAVLNDDQLHHIYGVHSPYKCSDALQRLKSLSRQQVIDGMIKDIRHAAAAQDNLHVKRRARRGVVTTATVFSPLINVPQVASQPIILGPLVFSPFIQSTTILGPIILSPWIFSPLILSPRLMSPAILSPHMFSPLVLTPIVLNPAILSPGIFTPFILSPQVLSPNILSPLAFSPLILSPFVLTPQLLTPTVGSPLVLSPFVLSPVILSSQAFSGLVLSPYAMSPVLLSPLAFFVAILSPSWLS